MEKSNETNDIRFHVRAGQNIHIRLYQAPTIEFPSATVTVLITNKLENFLLNHNYKLLLINSIDTSF